MEGVREGGRGGVKREEGEREGIKRYSYPSFWTAAHFEREDRDSVSGKANKGGIRERDGGSEGGR